MRLLLLKTGEYLHVVEIAGRAKITKPSMWEMTNKAYSIDSPIHNTV